MTSPTAPKDDLNVVKLRKLNCRLIELINQLINQLINLCTFDDKLTHLLQMTSSQPYIVDGIYNLARMAKDACFWMKQSYIVPRS